jgi:hypothetical protein
MGSMMAVVRGRTLGVFPVLINCEKENNSSNSQVIPCRHLHIVVAVQKGIDQGDKGEGRNQPIRNCDLLPSAR